MNQIYPKPSADGRRLPTIVTIIAVALAAAGGTAARPARAQEQAVDGPIQNLVVTAAVPRWSSDSGVDDASNIGAQIREDALEAVIVTRVNVAVELSVSLR